MANIDTEIAEIEGASTGEEVRQSLVDGLNAVNAGTLPAVSQSDSGKFMVVNNNGQWEVKSGGLVPTPTGTKNITQNGTHDVTNYASADVNVPNSYSASDEGKVVDNGALVSQTSRNVTQNGTYDTTTNDEIVVDVQGGGGGVIEPLSVTQNGTYAPPSGVDGYAPVTVNVSGGGGVELMTEAQWNALSTSEKQTHQYVGIVKYPSGFDRGDLVFGADYTETYLPYSENGDVLGEAFVGNYSPGAQAWGRYQKQIILPENMSEYFSVENAVWIHNTATACGGYIDLGSEDVPFTAYIVAKSSNPSTYSRILCVMKARAAGKGMLLYGGSNICVSQWAGDTYTNVSPTQYFVAAIAYGGANDACGAVRGGSPSYVTKTPSNCGRYIAIGRSDINSNTANAEPCDIFVKYMGVVNKKESQTVIMNNLDALYNSFLA